MRGARSGRPNRRPYYSESLSPRLSHGIGELRALYLGPWKYIYGPRPELYDLERDPAELQDLAAERPEERQRMEAGLRRFLAEHADPGAADATYEASEETRRRLAALGYVSSSSEETEAVTEVLRADGIAPQDQVGDINLQNRLRGELAAGRFQAALRMALRLLEADPGNPFYRASLAAAHLGLGDTEAAVRVVEETERVSAANIGQFLDVARALFDEGERERGLAMARRLVEADETPAGRLALGRMLLVAGDGAAFEVELERVLAMDEESREARLELAQHLLDAGRLEQAEGHLRRLLAAHPIDVEGLLGYARVLRRSGRGEEALAGAERVARLAPAWCEALLERLELLVELRREAEAEEAAAALRRTCRSEPETLARLATLMEEAG
jgi:tetratricopeptide (TPR) repeat protein